MMGHLTFGCWTFGLQKFKGVSKNIWSFDTFLSVIRHGPLCIQISQLTFCCQLIYRASYCLHWKLVEDIISKKSTLVPVFSHSVGATSHYLRWLEKFLTRIWMCNFPQGHVTSYFVASKSHPWGILELKESWKRPSIFSPNRRHWHLLSFSLLLLIDLFPVSHSVCPCVILYYQPFSPISSFQSFYYSLSLSFFYLSLSVIISHFLIFFLHPSEKVLDSVSCNDQKYKYVDHVQAITVFYETAMH